jgi:hypothetical protein
VIVHAEIPATETLTVNMIPVTAMDGAGTVEREIEKEEGREM